MIQTSLNEWETVAIQINRSKIKRYPYKSILGESLTNYILRGLNNNLSSQQLLGALVNDVGIKSYIFHNPQEKENLLKNLEINICSRFSEERRRGRI